jgi:multidrug transporter EmrE-like cation transporter
MVPPEVKVISTVITIFIVLWTGTALFVTLKPKTFWRITQGWKATSEPSTAYFVFSRIGTAICAIIGLVLLIQPYMHK